MRWVVVLLAALSAPALAVGPGNHVAGDWRVEVSADTREGHPVYLVRCELDGCPAVTWSMSQGELELVVLDDGDLVVVLSREGFTDVHYQAGSCHWTESRSIFSDGFERGLGAWSAVDGGAAAAYHHRRSFSYAPASRRQDAGLFLPPGGVR